MGMRCTPVLQQETMHHQQGKEPHQQGKEHHRIYGIDACTYMYPNDDDDDSRNVLAVFLSFFFFCTVQDQIFGYGYEQAFFVNLFFWNWTLI